MAIGQINHNLVDTCWQGSRQLPFLLPDYVIEIFLSPDYRGGYGWLFPKGASRQYRSRRNPRIAKVAQTLLASLRDKLANERRIGTRVFALTGGAIPVGPGVCDRSGTWSAPAVLLTGDAAGLTNPVNWRRHRFGRPIRLAPGVGMCGFSSPQHRGD